MPCHEGPCYPCTVTIDKSCHCAKTTVSIPCIRQKTAGPPRCRRPCTNKPQCDHPSIQKHACHFNNCPSCELICSKKLSGCQHSCTQKCHDAVYVKIQAEVSLASNYPYCALQYNSKTEYGLILREYIFFYRN